MNFAAGVSPVKTKAKPKPETKKDEILNKASRQNDEAFAQTQILGFYRERITAFEKDRGSFYEKLNDVKLKQEIVYCSEVELRKRMQEKDELDSAVEKCQ